MYVGVDARAGNAPAPGFDGCLSVTRQLKQLSPSLLGDFPQLAMEPIAEYSSLRRPTPLVAFADALKGPGSLVRPCPLPPPSAQPTVFRQSECRLLVSKSSNSLDIVVNISYPSGDEPQGRVGVRFMAGTVWSGPPPCASCNWTYPFEEWFEVTLNASAARGQTQRLTLASGGIRIGAANHPHYNAAPSVDLTLVRRLPESWQFRVLVDRSLVEFFGSDGRANGAAAYSPLGNSSTAIYSVWEPPPTTGATKPTMALSVWEMGTGYAAARAKW